VTTWATDADVAAALGVPISNPEHLTACVEAANAFAWRRRAQAGYLDDPDISPGPDATLGVIVYATALYRERGSVDSFASFEEFAAAGAVLPSGTFAQVLRLLGIPRPAVDRPSTADEIVALRHRHRSAYLAAWPYR
jgi:hypothetical protein